MRKCSLDLRWFFLVECRSFVRRVKPGDSGALPGVGSLSAYREWQQTVNSELVRTRGIRLFN